MDVVVEPAQSPEAGGCNACTRYATIDGTTPHRVWTVNARSASLRFCDECAWELAALLWTTLVGHAQRAFRQRALKAAIVRAMPVDSARMADLRTNLFLTLRKTLSL